MFGLGPMELTMILLIVVVLFGAGKLPQLGEGMGRAIQNFKGAVRSDHQSELKPVGKPNPSHAETNAVEQGSRD